MRLVSAARHAELQYRYERMAEAREAAEKLAEERLCTIIRLCEEIDELRPVTPEGRLPRRSPADGDTELRRQLHLARRAIAELDRQLAALQTSHEADTRELHDIRQGVTS